MPLYEHVFLARQDISSQQVESLTETFQNILKEGEGSVAKHEYWGLKTLAYKIKKNRKAHFTFMNIDAPHEVVAEMERQMRISSDILRFMTVRVDEHETNPSAMMRRSDRDDRRGGRRDRDHGPRHGRSGSREGRSGPREGRSGPREERSGRREDRPAPDDASKSKD